MQRRLSRVEFEQLVDQTDGASVDRLACRSGIHRTPVMAHLARSGTARRLIVRKMTDESVALAAARYEEGASLAKVADAFGAHEGTVAREFDNRKCQFEPDEVGALEGHGELFAPPPTVRRAEHDLASGTDACAPEQSIELDALVAQRIALVDIDHRRREACASSTVANNARMPGDAAAIGGFRKLARCGWSGVHVRSARCR